MPDSIQIQLKKGVLDLCVLALLSRSDGYAYEIAGRLARDIGMGEGTIYPLMRRMQADGLVTTYLVESASGPSRKYYRLTAAGRAALDAQRAEWTSLTMAVQKLLGEELMNRVAFLSRLEAGLAGLPPHEVADITADYAAHFDEGASAGRSEDDVAGALGDPTRLARELRAEAGLRRFETHRSPANLLRAGLALMGLATFDFFILLPLLVVALFLMAVAVFVLVIVGAVGFRLAIGGGFAPARLLAGLGLISGVIGTGALLLLLLEAAVRPAGRWLGRYARLHYKFLDPDELTD